MNIAKTSLTILTALLAMSTQARDLYLMNENWRSVCYPEGSQDSMVVTDLQLPHNWDDYYGYRQYRHGNLHGTARYERHFTLEGVTREANAMILAGQHYNLRLEGVGTYLTVILNGHEVCRHRPAGRVVTDLDVTPYLNVGQPKIDNDLTIICEHPSNITDMPWVCGGCSSESGFSEGSAPFGLFRNVSLTSTDLLCIGQYGVHAWASDALDTIYVDTDLCNYTDHAEDCVLHSAIQGLGKKSTVRLAAGEKKTVHQVIPSATAHLIPWSNSQPSLYTLTTTLLHGTQLMVADKVNTKVGFASVQWPGRDADGHVTTQEHRFLLNGKPVFINGVAEYEHLYGMSHALLYDEIDRRCVMIKKFGFNAFRDAHQPHNLRYAENWMQQGVLWWPQFSAHIWYDTPQFRENFKMLLRQWVRERRNNPAIILWGLQNESVLPEDFARECCAIIRELDPKCVRTVGGTGRLITTCNVGRGTDWNVRQNWSGTYGGVLENYGKEITQDEYLLVGEYGGWRSYTFHDKQDRGGIFDPKAPWTEEHQSALLHAKMVQAYQAREHVCGHFMWPLFSHDNPGRLQADEGYRIIDKVGPVNYKGLITAYWEPVDAYYLYLAWGAFFRGEWPKDTPDPTHLTAREMVKLGYKFEGVPLPDYLLADDTTGEVSRPDLHTFAEKTSVLQPKEERTYIYRYNCGGDELVDSYGNRWMGDDTRYSYNWSMAPKYTADHLNPVLGSQDLVRGWALDPSQSDGSLLVAKADQDLFRSYRFGRHEMRFCFPLPVGRLVEVEMWFVNTRHRVHKISYQTRVGLTGQLLITFPYVKIGQAKVSAIAISMDRLLAKDYGKVDGRGFFQFKNDALKEESRVKDEKGYPYSAGLTWAKLNTMTVEKTDPKSLPADPHPRPSAEYPLLNGEASSFGITFGVAQEYALRFRYQNKGQSDVSARWRILTEGDRRIVTEGTVTFPPTPNKYKVTATTTGDQVNAGRYILEVLDAPSIQFDRVEVQ